jgi:hypothetical protein
MARSQRRIRQPKSSRMRRSRSSTRRTSSRIKSPICLASEAKSPSVLVRPFPRLRWAEATPRWVADRVVAARRPRGTALAALTLLAGHRRACSTSTATAMRAPARSYERTTAAPRSVAVVIAAGATGPECPRDRARTPGRTRTRPPAPAGTRTSPARHIPAMRSASGAEGLPCVKADGTFAARVVPAK